MPSDIFFARYAPVTLEPKNSIGAKWSRLIDSLDLASIVKGKRTAIKVHLGGGSGFTTIHPFFVRVLVAKTKEAGAKEVFLADAPWAIRSAVERGYTPEVVGCQLLPVAGSDDSYIYPRRLDPPLRELTEVHLAGEIVNAEALIDLAHVKGHGDCGFGGASKNLSMGCVDTKTRGSLHALEGGLEWDGEMCTLCKVCEENCPNSAISFKNDIFEVFYHNCKLCQHCVLICPQRAISMVGGVYRDFQRGLALTTAEVLATFPKEHVLFINMLMSITIFCDCWGMTTPSLVPDIGILGGRDIVAIEQASLDLIHTEDLIPGSLPRGWELGARGHLFERIHGKDPHAVVEFLEELGWGSREYALVDVQ